MTGVLAPNSTHISYVLFKGAFGTQWHFLGGLQVCVGSLRRYLLQMPLLASFRLSLCSGQERGVFLWPRCYPCAVAVTLSSAAKSFL